MRRASILSPDRIRGVEDISFEWVDRWYGVRWRLVEKLQGGVVNTGAYQAIGSDLTDREILLAQGRSLDVEGARIAAYNWLAVHRSQEEPRSVAGSETGEELLAEVNTGAW